jgi:hypothetical protein
MIASVVMLLVAAWFVMVSSGLKPKPGLSLETNIGAGCSRGHSNQFMPTGGTVINSMARVCRCKQLHLSDRPGARRMRQIIILQHHPRSLLISLCRGSQDFQFPSNMPVIPNIRRRRNWDALWATGSSSFQ